MKIFKVTHGTNLVTFVEAANIASAVKHVKDKYIVSAAVATQADMLALGKAGGTVESAAEAKNAA